MNTFLACVALLIVSPSLAQQPCCQAHPGAGCADASCAAAVCALDAFCCSVEWDTRCASEASVACASCRPAPGCNVPAATVADTEPCGLVIDDPCAATPGTPRPLPLDTLVAGSLWTTAEGRDVDWFQLTLPSAARLRVEVFSAGPVGSLILDSTCPPTVHAESPDGCPSICEACLPAGTWRVAVRPLLFEPLACGDPLGTYAVRATVQACAPSVPPNDRCDSALAASLGDNAFDTTQASTEPSWLPPMCDEGAGLAFTHDVWFTFTAPQSAEYTLSTCGTPGFDARLALHDACGGDVLACSDDACADGGASIAVPLACGQTVLVRVGGWGHGTAGALQIATTDGVGCECPGDLDGSREVDSSDAAVLLLSFGEAGGPADLDQDGEVGSADLGLLLLMIGPCS